MKAIRFTVVLSFIIVTTKSYSESTPIILNKVSVYSITDWQTFNTAETTESFLIEVIGSNNTTYQVTDLIAPDGTVYVKSNLNINKLTGHEIPHAHNQTGKNRSLSVIEKQSALLVPNFYMTEPLPHGTWKYRVLGSNYFKNDSVKVNIVETQKRNLTRLLNIKLYIERDSFWSQNSEYTEDVLSQAKIFYKNHDIELEITSELFDSATSNYDAPKDVVTIIETNKFMENTPELSVKYLLIGKMQYQSKPINGLSCLSGLASKSNCFAAMFADPLLAHTMSSMQAGKIFAHELGHHLGLFHTKDAGLMFTGSVFDPFSDTSEIILGTNIMDPGIHNDQPEFSMQQLHVLRSHPLVKNYEK